MALWGSLAQHQVTCQLMGPGSVMVEGGQLQLEHLQGLYCVATVEVLHVLLLQQYVLHLQMSVLVLQMRGQILQNIHCSRPVSLHDTVSEGGGCGLVQTASCLLHQHISTCSQSYITQVLTNQSYYLNIWEGLKFNFLCLYNEPLGRVLISL